MRAGRDARWSENEEVGIDGTANPDGAAFRCKTRSEFRCPTPPRCLACALDGARRPAGGAIGVEHVHDERPGADLDRPVEQAGVDRVYREPRRVHPMRQ
jgi:hypothetical protein